MYTQAKHLIVEFWGCDTHILGNPEIIEKVLTETTRVLDEKVISIKLHSPSEEHVRGIVLMSDSHLTFHASPKSGYVAVDFYTHQDFELEKAHNFLAEKLRAEKSEEILIERGLQNPSSKMVGTATFQKCTKGPSMKMRHHLQNIHDHVSTSPQKEKAKHPNLEQDKEIQSTLNTTIY